MAWLYTWGGTCFGWRDGDDLWTHDGRHVGRFHRDEVYGPDGRYLGELQGGRLIRKKGRLDRRSGFTRRGPVIGRVRNVNLVGSVMLSGYENFPDPEEF